MVYSIDVRNKECLKLKTLETQCSSICYSNLKLFPRLEEQDELGSARNSWWLIASSLGLIKWFI